MERTSERVLAKPAQVNMKLASDLEEGVAMLDSDGNSDMNIPGKDKAVTPSTPSFSVCDAWESFQDAVQTVDMKTVGTALRRLPKWTVASVIRLPRIFVNGIFGEVIWNHERDKRWWYVHGILLVTFLYLGFVLFTVVGPLYKQTNVSICGYLEIVPSYYAFLFCMVAAVGAESTMWNIVHVVRTEKNTFFAAVQMMLGSICAVGLVGFTAFPRCKWDIHQTLVLSWTYAGTLAMLISLIRDYKKPHYTVVPFVCWLIGIGTCALYYHNPGWTFYNAEGLSVLSYIAWCSSMHLRFGRSFFCPYILAVNGPLGFVVLKLLQNNLSTCTVKEMQPQLMALKWVPLD